MRPATVTGSTLVAPLVMAAGLLAASPATGQPVEGPDRVDLITVSPGTSVASRFGHSAIRVRTARNDIAWSFGQSSVDDWNAASLLLQGRRLDRVRRLDPEALVGGYLEAGRSVHIQTLRLDRDQTAELRAILEADLERLDAYGAIAANCTTRIRDALDRVLAGSLRTHSDSLSPRWTPRERLAGYTARDPVLHLVVHSLLGPEADRPATAWESMFLPATLRDGLRSVEVPTQDGRRRPLVAEERTMAAGGESEPRPQRAWSPLWLILGSATAGLMAVPARRSRRAFMILGSAWALGFGVAGFGLLVLGLSTADPHLSGNTNAWIANPILIVGAVLMWGGRPSPRLAALVFAVVVIAGLGAVAVTLLGVPTGIATSLAGALLPGHAVLALGCWTERTRTTDSRGPSGLVSAAAA